jgi:hypothetical protein
MYRLIVDEDGKIRGYQADPRGEPLPPILEGVTTWEDSVGNLLYERLPDGSVARTEESANAVTAKALQVQSAQVDSDLPGVLVDAIKNGLTWEEVSAKLKDSLEKAPIAMQASKV